MPPARSMIDAILSTKMVSGECWLWPGRVDRDGYGKVRQCVSGKRIKRSVHKVAFEYFKGPIPEGLVVMHSCDVRRCWNPKHLTVGTNIQNIEDRDNKQRQCRGSSQKDAKLTDLIVMMARLEYSKGLATQVALAKKYGVTKMAMHWAITGKAWKHVQF
jgi:HNH endonuclease